MAPVVALFSETPFLDQNSLKMKRKPPKNRRLIPFPLPGDKFVFLLLFFYISCVAFSCTRAPENKETGNKDGEKSIYKPAAKTWIQVVASMPNAGQELTYSPRWSWYTPAESTDVRVNADWAAIPKRRYSTNQTQINFLSNWTEDKKPGVCGFLSRMKEAELSPVRYRSFDGCSPHFFVQK